MILNNLRFPGQYYDAETGLHYNWHRFYDPETGRYITADPIGLAGGMNLYAYVAGDPVNAVDPEGLMAKKPKLWNIADSIKSCRDFFGECPNEDNCYSCCSALSSMVPLRFGTAPDANCVNACMDENSARQWRKMMLEKIEKSRE